MLIQMLVSLLALLGAAFILIGAIGLVRLPDFFTRLHGPTKATTLGIGGILIASMLHFSTQGHGLSLREALVALFLFITAPVSAHLLSKAALHARLGEPVPTRSDSTPDPDGEHSQR